MSDPITTIRRGPCILEFKGRRWTAEFTETRIEDIRETPIGKVNFGRVYWGPSRMVEMFDE